MARKFVVSPAPIRRELRNVARKLLKLKKRAFGPELKAIELELELLEDCFNKLGNVRWP
jgi:hypothetical protein